MLVERVRTGRGRVALATVVMGLIVIGGAWTLRAQDDANLVARVNGEAITKDELFDMMFQYVGQQVLDELILIRLVEQEASAGGVAVSDEEVQAELDAFAARGRPGAAGVLLMQQGMTVEQLSEQLR